MLGEEPKAGVGLWLWTHKGFSWVGLVSSQQCLETAPGPWELTASALAVFALYVTHI